MRCQTWHKALEFGVCTDELESPDHEEFPSHSVCLEVQIKYNQQLNTMQTLPEHGIL